MMICHERRCSMSWWYNVHYAVACDERKGNMNVHERSREQVVVDEKDSDTLIAGGKGRCGCARFRQGRSNFLVLIRQLTNRHL